MENKISDISIEITIQKPVAKVWEIWTTAADIMQWNVPFDNWHSPRAKNDLHEGGSFCYRMEAKDGSEGFDHSGIFAKIIPNQLKGTSKNPIFLRHPYILI
jgi:uncharacterized protein YndB with AHSA1/START domain